MQPDPDPTSPSPKSRAPDPVSGDHYELLRGSRGRHARPRPRKRDQRLVADMNTDGLKHKRRLAGWRSREERGQVAIEAIHRWALASLLITAALSCAACLALGVVRVALDIHGGAQAHVVMLHTLTSSLGATGSLLLYRAIRRQSLG